MHTTSFWRWYAVVWTSTTLLQSWNNAVCLLGYNYTLYSLQLTNQPGQPHSKRNFLFPKMLTAERWIRFNSTKIKAGANESNISSNIVNFWCWMKCWMHLRGFEIYKKRKNISGEIKGTVWMNFAFSYVGWIWVKFI